MNFFSTLNRLMIVEFSGADRIIHFTATEPIIISDEHELQLLNVFIVEKILEYSDKKRVFLIIDYYRIVIDPKLAQLLADITSKLYEKYLFENGGCSYGHSVSRITSKISGKSNFVSGRFLYKTKKEAFEAMRQLAQQILVADSEDESYLPPIEDFHYAKTNII